MSMVTATAASIADTVPWPQLGFGGLLTVAIGMILTGRLVPRSSLRDAQRTSDKWEAAWREESELTREQSVQLNQLTELGHTTVALLQSITTESSRPGKGGG